jgi:predicted nuclease of predicted toxin-antitoxin system
VGILLDEMMPRRFADALVGHDIAHVVDLGWRQVTNGQLLSLSESAGFAVLITKDSNLPYQQNLAGRRIAVVVLRPASQDLVDLIALAPDVLRILPEVRAGSVSTVTAESTRPST